MSDENVQEIYFIVGFMASMSFNSNSDLTEIIDND